MEQDEALLADGVARLEAGDLAGAEAALRQVGVASYLCRDALVALSRVMVAGGQLAEAQRCAEEADNLERDARSLFQLGAVWMARGDATRARGFFDQALDRQPDFVDAHIMLGHAHKAVNATGPAMRAFEEALRHEDAHAGARYYLAELLLELGDIARAHTQLHYLLQLQPDYGPAIVLMGDIAFHHKDYRQAIVEYVRGAQRGAADADVLHRLGQAFQYLGDRFQALKAFDRAIKENRQSWPIYQEAALICEEMTWFNRGRRYHEALTFVQEFRIEAYKGLARVEAGIQATGMVGIDPAGAPEDNYDYLEGPFDVPDVLTAEQAEAAVAQATAVAVAPKLIGRAGRVGGDAFGVGAETAGYMADFVNAPVAPPPPPKPPAP
ncbi:MAG: sulfotransferase, partial [Cyanobacteria bacterium RYN_339]|nr:sulfotransferase [Cyanobacteria bacterium RYN_339]